MKEPIYSRADGTYVIENNGYPYHVIPSDPLFAEVTAYLLDHPEALVPEPVPPPPTGEELAARRVAEAKARMDALDRASVRPLRSVTAGSPTQADLDRLAAIETEVNSLRSLIHTLEAI